MVVQQLSNFAEFIAMKQNLQDHLLKISRQYRMISKLLEQLENNHVVNKIDKNIVNIIDLKLERIEDINRYIENHITKAEHKTTILKLNQMITTVRFKMTLMQSKVIF